MIAMTNANMRNLPTVATPAPEKSWDKQNDAIAAAIRELGPEARHRFEFTTMQLDDGRWTWTLTDPDSIPAPTGFQFKINGGKRAFLTTMAEKQRRKDLTKPTDMHLPEARNRPLQIIDVVKRHADNHTLKLIVDDLLDVPGDAAFRVAITKMAEELE